MYYLQQEYPTDILTCNTWKIATTPTAMDEDGLPAEPATSILSGVLILLFY